MEPKVHQATGENVEKKEFLETLGPVGTQGNGELQVKRGSWVSSLKQTVPVSMIWHDADNTKLLLLSDVILSKYSIFSINLHYHKFLFLFYFI